MKNGLAYCQPVFFGQQVLIRLFVPRSFEKGLRLVRKTSLKKQKRAQNLFWRGVKSLLTLFQALLPSSRLNSVYGLAFRDS